MKLVYCDWIADLIKVHINEVEVIGRKFKASKVKMDLHPTDGYMMSTTKTIKVKDWNGKQYEITVEEV